jgi:hypothetical protein
MFQKKEYHSKQERKRDRFIGIAVFIIGNLLAGLGQLLLQSYASSPYSSSSVAIENSPAQIALLIFATSLAWIVNLLLIGYGLFVRREFVVGVLAILVMSMIIPTFLMVLFVPACLVSMVVSTPFWLFGELVGGVCFGLILAFCLIYPLYHFWFVLQPLLSTWWAYPEDNPETPPEKAWVSVPDIRWENDVPIHKRDDDVG